MSWAEELGPFAPPPHQPPPFVTDVARGYAKRHTVCAGAQGITRGAVRAKRGPFQFRTGRLIAGGGALPGSQAPHSCHWGQGNAARAPCSRKSTPPNLPPHPLASEIGEDIGTCEGAWPLPGGIPPSCPRAEEGEGGPGGCPFGNAAWGLKGADGRRTVVGPSNGPLPRLKPGP